jgi:NAD(P)-dependent dehydrogenase (short-subunit alcohol dehydrogenase family)
MSDLTGRRALVTGGASGIGEAIARQLAGAGANVMIGDVDTVAGAAVAASFGGTFVSLDVACEDAWAAAMAAVEASLGGLDILVNNAGITIMGSIEDISLADFQLTLDVDLIGVFLGCKAAIAMMKRNGGGAIVNISSTSGLKATADLAAYNAAKAGVTLLTKSVALHCAEKRYGIRCNSVHPGVIRTPILDKVMAQVADPQALMAGFVAQHPIGNIGDTDDIADIVHYLVGPRAKFITGSAFVVDGGLTL